MNEYLCHGYMAEEIFKEVTAPRTKRRPESSPSDNPRSFLGNDNVTIHDKLLSDEGSSKYKNWLQRTTTLDDVYRHYTAPHKKITKKQDVQHEDIEEFDGEVTGYAMQAPLPSGKVGLYDPSHEVGDMSPSAGHHSFHYGPAFGHHHGEHFGQHGDFFPSIHEEYYYAPPQHHDHGEEYHRPSYSKGKGHDLSVKDFFEIALTALAFLAFGLFIIQLLMNATNNPPMMMTTGRARVKRDAFPVPLSSASNEDLNDLAYRVLRSIEAAMIAETDSGNCLRRILCEDNQYSKVTNDSRRIWVPVWR
ncbi:hypothetical protein EAI_06168 [Harpegnathos saltator]|uniref:Uncharacterized protein n=1 Tax=Harpegnathos saltator TaxID=610380 RepID=E2C9I2_HARSA|nr:hypothetical protein EAI_06168 [Harpegnathos saltator]